MNSGGLTPVIIKPLPSTGSAGPDRYPRLTGRWLLVGRLTWIAGALVMLGFTLAGAAPRYRQLHDLAWSFQAELGAALRITPDLYAGYIVTVAVILLAIYAIPAAVIYWRRQYDWLALLISMTLLGIATASTDFSDALLVAHPEWYIPVDLIRAASEDLPHIALFVFPTGLAQPRWTRYLVVGKLAWMLIRPLLYHTSLHPNAWPQAVYLIWALFWLGGGLAAQIYRYTRIASQAQKQQTKWVVFGSAITITVYLLIQVARIFVPQAQVDGTLEWLIARPIEYTVFALGLLPLPIALTISIMRYRLWDIDFLINRSLVYGALTLLLMSIFGGSLFVATRIFERITGGGQSIIAVGATAMIFGALFGPSRRMLQRFVDSRLYGIRLAYQRRPGDMTPIPAGVLGGRDLAAYGEMTLLGRGGMAEVYLAIHPRLRCPVAIKILNPHLAERPDFRQRFEREARIVAALKHPAIVDVYDFGEAGGTHYMVMEYLEGQTLAELLQREGRLSLDRAIPFIEDIAGALDYAHDQGLVHRDIKPSNVMIVPGTDDLRPLRAVLMDFGIARMVERESGLTQTGVVGTFDYIPPEQIRGEVNLDRRADIYSLGVMCFQLLTGRLPFTASNPGALLMAHLQQPPPNAVRLAPDLPFDAADALMRAMAKNPAQRQPTAGALAWELRAALSRDR